MLRLEPEIGDILLIPLHDLEKSPNTFAQSILRFRRAQFAHVAIAVGRFTALHAMPDDGVHAVWISSLVDPCPQGSLRVIRNISLSGNAELHTKLRSRLLFYYRQKYNIAFFFRRFENASYCSELAAKAYADVGLPLSHRSPKYVLPVDLEQLPADRWIDVTSAYVAPAEPIQKSALELYMDPMFAGSALTHAKTEKFLIEAEEALYRSELDQLTVSGLQDQMRQLLGVPAVTINLVRDTWLRADAARKSRKPKNR